MVTLIPPSDVSRMTVRLLTGMGAGVYFDLSRFSFQVPTELSALKATAVTTAKTASALPMVLRMGHSPFGERWYHGRLVPYVRKLAMRWGGSASIRREPARAPAADR